LKPYARRAPQQSDWCNWMTQFARACAADEPAAPLRDAAALNADAQPLHSIPAHAGPPSGDVPVSPLASLRPPLLLPLPLLAPLLPVPLLPAPLLLAPPPLAPPLLVLPLLAPLLPPSLLALPSGPESPLEELAPPQADNAAATTPQPVTRKRAIVLLQVPRASLRIYLCLGADSPQVLPSKADSAHTAPCSP
jgi:hypothetical protein